MKWVCTVCNYVHNGDAPPDVCPVCGAKSDAFERVDETETVPAESPADQNKSDPVEDGTASDGSGESNRWRCLICNYIHAHKDPPDVCPICGAGKKDFVAEKQSPEHHHRGWSGLVEKLHLHPVSAHMPNGALPLAFLSWMAYLLFSEACLERTSFYLMLVSAAAVPFTAITGWSDARHRFGTTITGVFPEKKRLSLLLFAVMWGMAIWRLVLGWHHTPDGTETIVFTLLLVGATGVAARLGMLGGKLVFGH